MNATVRLSGNDGTERKFRLPKTSLLAITGLALLGALPASAGVKYWDNPGFKSYDVGDYVQDGLVLHYDGIRNAGAGAAHSDAAVTWANLASGGSLPLTWCSWISSDSKYQRVRNDTTQGAWEENGFHFDGRSVFATEESSNLFSLPETYTMQFTMTADLSEATGADGSGYLFRPGKDWSQGGVAVRNTANGSITPANAVYVVDNARFNTNNTRPNFADATPRYATILGTSASLACFDGTSIPEVGTTYTDSCRANVKTRSAHANNWLAFGAQYYGTSTSTTTRDTVLSIQGFNGTLHAVRYYSKALSADDLAWNRVIDEYRFFGASAPIPVTNVVVATAAEGAEGDQPCGAYAVDAEGYTFTAPAQRTIKGKRYVLTGYTIETWNVSDWGAAVEHDGNSYEAKSPGKVRLTWQYERPAGEGQFKTYDVGDYVQDGLLLHYDGIRNVGAAAAHDPDAHQWMNLAPGYESRWPMDWCSYTESSTNNYAWHRNDYTQGAWTDDGFAFNGKGYFAKWNDGDTFAVPANFTVQISVTGAIADQLGDPAYLWTGQPGWSYGSIAMRKSNNSAANGNSNSVYYVNSTVHPTERPNFYPAGAKPSYVTAIVDYDDTKTTYIFDGIARPAAGGRDAPAISGTSPATNMTWFSVGGFHGRSGTAANLQSFNGTVHSFRFYNRVLTDAEVAQNRKVDEFRFHGRCDVTVQSTYSYLEGYDKNGCYDVDGSYTFVAPESVTAPNGITYVCDGYTVETRDANGIWGGAVSHDGTSYLYETSAGTVRLTWKWKATSGLRTAADYSLDDLSPAGLRLHYDGKLNAGVGVAHSATATKWVNLGSDGAAMDLTRATASGATAEQIGGWTDDGYAFGGHSQFNSGRVPWGDTFTAQCLADADMAANAAAASDAAAKGNHINVFATTWDRMGVRILGDKTVRLNVQGQNTTGPRFSPGDTLTYLTAIEDASAKTASMFSGTVAPTKGSAAQGFTSLSSIGNVYTNALRLGGWGGSLSDPDNVIGTIKSFRYYDRVLTEEELVRNRNVDAARYFGELGVTNVLVTVEDGAVGIAPVESGACFVEGQYTFTATGPAGLGYKLSVPDGNGGWQTLSAFAEGGSYTYTDGTSPACVKLEWRLQKPFTIIIR